MTDRTLVVAVFNESQKWTLPEELVARLGEGVPQGVDVRRASSRVELIDLLDGADYMMGFPLTESQFQALPTTPRFVQLVTAWADSLAPIQAALDTGVRLSGTAHIRAEPVAEHAVALLLALSRRLDIAIAAQVNHRWAAGRVAKGVHDIVGATVGLVNFGPAGRAIATRLRAFGCEILATGSPTGQAGQDAHDAGLVDQLLPPANVDELISRSNVVILADAQPGQTRPLLDRALFEQMRPGTLLVNVASGGAIAESELLWALRKGKLAGAALDCFEHRPLDATSPLWNVSTVILTPSVATASPLHWRRAVDFTIENLIRFEAGEPLIDEIAASSSLPAS